MIMSPAPRPGRCLLLLAAAVMSTGCDDRSPVAPDALMPVVAEAASADNRALAKLRRATARYHDVNAAIADGFILLHECEVRPGEGAVGILYIHLGRYLDGVLDAETPDGLLYAPNGNGKLKLTGVEVALPAAMWTAPEPPEFLGVPLQFEAEFDAWGLHVWVWRHNPDGMFAQAHADIACELEA